MTSHNICRNIHPVFVVLLAVSLYESFIETEGLFKIHLEHIELQKCKQQFLGLLELYTTMWKSEPPTWIW